MDTIMSEAIKQLPGAIVWLLAIMIGTWYVSRKYSAFVDKVGKNSVGVEEAKKVSEKNKQELEKKLNDCKATNGVMLTENARKLTCIEEIYHELKLMVEKRLTAVEVTNQSQCKKLDRILQLLDKNK